MARKPTTKERPPAKKPDAPPEQPKRAPQRKRRAPSKTKGKAKTSRSSRAPRPVGRPSKIDQRVKVRVPNGKTGKVEEKVLTVGEAFVAVLESGCSIETAAATVGLSKQTVYDWQARAEEHRDSDRVPAGEQKYLDFSDALTRAREQVVTLALAGILEQGKSDWRALAWFLERSRPEEFGRSTKIDVGGSDGKGGRMTFAEFMATAGADPSTVSDEDDPDLRDRSE